ncbi:alpha-amylase family glycosyl hydrolase [Flavobacterium sp.]|jgi:1,4-alpha-glucan branching enzyme|uniref:alpha-amylase family glycosyl hydrolase n=1 Tax=Flavobacterium sp. TaxID=239 RepID=UPI0037BE28BE
MKKIVLFTLLLSTLHTFAQLSWQGGTTPEQTSSATLLFNKSGTPLAGYTGVIYAHIGVTLNGTPWQGVIGSWGNNSLQPSLTLVSGTTYKLDLTPTIQSFFGISSGTISKINVVLRGSTGSPQTTDLEINVGAFQVNLTAPLNNSTTILNSGAALTVAANNTNGTANYVLKGNGTTLNTATGVASYSYTHINITTNQYYALEVTQGAITTTKNFRVLVNPNTTSLVMPAGLVNGINYNTSDNTKATLVLDAPLKDFVYVAGSFNNWNPSSSYAMKKDPSSGKYWLELTGLTPGTNYSYQYWVVDQTPIANSPALVKVADPCSTTVLSPYDDPYISSTTYPNLPVYPAGQEREVTLLKTGQTAYNWQVPNFTKPNKDKLVVYELLIRDFDANRNFQDVINRIQYFRDLGINAIELMPVMEFEGNESWGYNTAFHMALDKFYGTPEKFKELVDVCHQNGIAIILDLAFNHAFGRNPMVRMWMNDADGDGWGPPSSENPYFNTVAKHSYSVGEDFNHASALTKTYVKQTIKQWITEFKIDGFRWDLTKGFTQNCTASDQTCTNNYQQDRVDILKDYADYSWSLDPNHYVIFEHLGSDNEEQQWANYRLSEGKGIMMWGEMFSQYKELALGFSGQNISRMSHTSRGFTGKRLLGYPESHDKDRLMYEAITYGSTTGTSPVNGNLTNALNRMGAIGATSILVPGPKMIWHFAELGNNQSIYTCADGSVNTENDATTGDCKLATKAQVQWTQNWLADARRASILSDWSKLIKLKTSEPVFVGDHAISPESSNNFKQRIYIYNNTFTTAQLRNVVVLANFSPSDLTINPNFPTDVYTYPMTWYDLMNNNTAVTITSPTDLVTVNSGRFRVFGNRPATLSSEDYYTFTPDVIVYPNPVKNSFAINQEADSVEIYNLTGQLVGNYAAISADQVINIDYLQSGIYLVKIKTNTGLIQTKKISKE